MAGKATGVCDGLCNRAAIGALFLTILLNGMNLLQIHSSWQPLVTGCIILLAVWIDNRTRRIGE